MSGLHNFVEIPAKKFEYYLQQQLYSFTTLFLIHKEGYPWILMLPKNINKYKEVPLLKEWTREDQAKQVPTVAIDAITQLSGM